MKDIHSIYYVSPTTKLNIIHKILKNVFTRCIPFINCERKGNKNKDVTKIVSKISQITSMVTLLTYYSALPLSLYACLQKLKLYYLDTGVQITVDVQLVLLLQHLLSWHHAL